MAASTDSNALGPSPTEAHPIDSQALDEGERSQISFRLGLTPLQRLGLLLDQLAFEERARRARVLGPVRTW